MAIIKSSVKLILKENVVYKYKEPVLTLGVPEVYATYSELQVWFKSLAGQSCQVTKAQVKVSSNVVGQKLQWVSPKTFFKAFGFSEMMSMDIPGCEHAPDVVHDLNAPLPAELVSRFNLIVDPGTIEHVFDVKTCLTNVVRALKVGGVVIHQVPIYSYNGGYYSINPNVMHDFYHSNGFGSLKAYIIMWDRYHAYTGKNRCYLYSDQFLGKRHAVGDHDQCRFSPMLLFFARKMKESENIVIPVQFEGQYVKSPVFIPNKSFVKRLYRKVVNQLPFPISFYIDAVMKREKDLYRTRKHSFWI